MRPSLDVLLLSFGYTRDVLLAMVMRFLENVRFHTRRRTNRLDGQVVSDGQIV